MNVWLTMWRDVKDPSRAPASRQTHNTQLLKHLLPSFWVRDLGLPHTHYDNPSGSAKYKKCFLDHIS